MRLWRLELGVSKFEPGHKPRFTFSYHKGACGCHLLDFHALYFTWLGNECYASSRVQEQEGGSQEVGSPSSSDRGSETIKLQDPNAPISASRISDSAWQVQMRKMSCNKRPKRNSRRSRRPRNKR